MIPPAFVIYGVEELNPRHYQDRRYGEAATRHSGARDDVALRPVEYRKKLFSEGTM